MFGINAAARQGTKMFEKAVNSDEGRKSLHALPKKLEGRPNAARVSVTKKGEVKLYGRFSVLLHPHQRARGQAYMNHLGRFLARDTACRVLDEEVKDVAPAGLKSALRVNGAASGPRKTVRINEANNMVREFDSPELEGQEHPTPQPRSNAKPVIAPKPVVAPKSPVASAPVVAPRTTVSSAPVAAPRRAVASRPVVAPRSAVASTPVAAPRSAATPAPVAASRSAVTSKPVIPPKPVDLAARLHPQATRSAVAALRKDSVQTEAPAESAGKLVQARVNFFETKPVAVG